MVHESNRRETDSRRRAGGVSLRRGCFGNCFHPPGANAPARLLLAEPFGQRRLVVWDRNTTKPPPTTKPGMPWWRWHWAGLCSALASCRTASISGLCEFRKGAFRPTEDWLEREMLMALGGIAAEARHTNNYAWDGAARDLQYVRLLAVQRAGERRAQRLERRCWPRSSIFSPRKDTGGPSS